MSQQQLADQSGISLRTIQRIEGNENKPHAYTLKTLAQSLEIPYEELASPIPLKKEKSVKWVLISSFLLIVPIFSNVLIPGTIYIANRQKEGMQFWGSRMLTFQIIWTIITFLLILLSRNLAMLIFGTSNPGDFHPILFTYQVCVLINLLITSWITYKYSKGDKGIIQKFPSFF